MSNSMSQILNKNDISWDSVKSKYNKRTIFLGLYYKKAVLVSWILSSFK